ncbi:molybdopterin molybdotransferase MoeA [Methylobrevis albus]|uniref:molybdopterin molybdotransferase MoeA n=1 Tax=Methylobrevis albus TaxID=2793297 RepID=UPI002E2BDF2A|nr:gephyrin-like molybdotransferase Glp [Methylobrevis albus]
MSAPDLPRFDVDDCFRTGEPSLRHDEAVALILARTAAVTGTERVAVAAAGGRVLAETVAAPRDVPMTDTAAVDGWAFRAADLGGDGGALPISGHISAGPAREAPIAPGTAVRIFTGAPMPPGADTVAMQEHCMSETLAGAPAVRLPAGLRPGANRRRAGEDVAAGTLVLRAGTRLRPQDLASLGSIGRAEITVVRPLRVALVSTGDEIVRPGEPIRPGQVYDSNHLILTALLAGSGLELADHGVLPDDEAVVRRVIAGLSQSHDLIVSTGGTSRGEGDHIAAAVAALGRRHLWHLAVKPGRPLALGQIGGCLFLGLPGNPVAVFVTALLYGQPLLARLSGAAWRPPTRFPLPAGFDAPARKTGRREFLRGILETGPDGRLQAGKYGRDGSGLISGLRAADGLVEIGEDVPHIARGDLVDFIPFTEFGISPRSEPG